MENEYTEPQVASFLLRFTQHIWQNEQGDPKVDWRGTVQHVQNETTTHFTEFVNALGFIQAQLADVTRKTLKEQNKMDMEKGMQESFKLLDQFSKQYSEMMLGTVQKNLDQTTQWNEKLSESMRNSFQSWITPPDVLLQQTLTELKNEIVRLNERMDKLEQKG